MVEFASGSYLAGRAADGPGPVERLAPTNTFKVEGRKLASFTEGLSIGSLGGMELERHNVRCLIAAADALEASHADSTLGCW